MNVVHYYCTLWLNVLLSSGYQSLCHYVWSTNSWISAESHSPSLLILPIKSIHVPQLKCIAFHSPFLYFFPRKTVIVFQVVTVSCVTAKIHIIVDPLKRRSGASWKHNTEVAWLTNGWQLMVPQAPPWFSTKNVSQPDFPL